MQISEDGEAFALIEDIPAGSMLSNLSFVCTDETGKPAEAGTSGKVQVSWTRGAKRVKLGEEATKLPDLQVALFLLQNQIFLQMWPIIDVAIATHPLTSRQMDQGCRIWSRPASEAA